VPVYLEDRRLVKRVLAGEESAFNRFFDENFGRLYRFALPRLENDRQAATAVVQVALSRALEKIHSYRGEAALFTWLCTICRNEITDRQRRSARLREHVVLTEDFPEIRAAVDSFRAPATDEPAKNYQKHEAARLIQVALDRLPPRYGDALEWKYIEGFSVKEIAARLEVSPEAAQSLLARAKRAFKELYSTMAKPVFNEITT
jgi:RNA polymerase sigma-70 factor (ECF subfamily)